MVTPRRSGSKVRSLGRPFTRTRYFRSQPVDGSSSRRFSSPSFVSSSSPSELRSRRPTLITRGMPSGRVSNTVWRPFSSLVEVTRPKGL